MTDWESLSKQLQALGVELGKDARIKSKPKNLHPVENVIDGRFIEFQVGQVYCHEEFYPFSHYHGKQPLQLANPIETLCRWAKASDLTADDLEHFIFLDTETSGLAGGTGTYAFEVGLGRFTAEGFHLAQFFMRHPGEEPALLSGLSAFMEGLKAVVTYNGKAFDIPLLNTRYTLLGMTSPFEGVDHFDLLPLARRLWTHRLESRTLGQVENRILGVERSDEEIPGYLIPEIYFDYLRTQDARPLEGVFYHNAVDILSLAGLFSHMSFLLDQPLSEKIQHAEDTLSLAQFFESINDLELAQELYQRALDSQLPDKLHWDALERFSFMLKRSGNWPAAVNLWEQAADHHQLYAFEELAKYYEHRAKDLDAAHQWTVKAIRTLDSHKIPSYQYAWWQESLNHRLNRLERRLAAQSSSESG